MPLISLLEGHTLHRCIYVTIALIQLSLWDIVGSTGQTCLQVEAGSVHE